MPLATIWIDGIFVLPGPQKNPGWPVGAGSLWVPGPGVFFLILRHLSVLFSHGFRPRRALGWRGWAACWGKFVAMAVACSASSNWL